MTIRDYHYPSGELKMPIENDFTRAYGAIKELEARVERLEGWPKTTKPAEHVADFLDSAVLSRDLELAEQEICTLESENHQLRLNAARHMMNIEKVAVDGMTDLITENNQLRFVLSILAAVKDDGWIEWHGGECPVDPRMLVEVKMPYGDVLRGRGWDWKHRKHALDIIAYRIAR